MPRWLYRLIGFREPVESVWMFRRWMEMARADIRAGRPGARVIWKDADDRVRLTYHKPRVLQLRKRG
jgi:urocanate hydratase